MSDNSRKRRRDRKLDAQRERAEVAEARLVEVEGALRERDEELEQQRASMRAVREAVRDFFEAFDAWVGNMAPATEEALAEATETLGHALALSKPRIVVRGARAVLADVRVPQDTEAGT